MKLFDTKKLLNICIAFSKEQDYAKLIEIILEEAMSITNCDAGTLYVREDDKLYSKITATKSLYAYQGVKDTQLRQPVEVTRNNVCSYVALEKTVLNIDDVYNSKTFDFSEIKKSDAMTGCKTQSMLVAPMKDDKDEVIGVLQLINAKDENNKIIPFAEIFALTIISLGAQAAICLSNIKYAQESIELLNSFVNVMSTAIDERSPYNANHTKNMEKYAENFIQWLAQTNNKWQFDQNKKNQFLMSVQLHDIGKLIIPLDIMNKETRLSSKLSEVMDRFKIIELITKVNMLQQLNSSNDNQVKAEADFILKEIQEAKIVVEEANKASVLPEKIRDDIFKIGRKIFIDTDGIAKKWLTEEELTSLLVEKGTLTSEEREIMESHVVLTEKMLEQMKFTKAYKNVTSWSSTHHELINGKGYPNQLSGNQISPEVRLLTILDIFDALTARDRPYKPAMPVEKAFSILGGMVDEGQIDGNILDLFKQSKAYQLEV